MKVGIVGGGTFGSTIGRALQEKGCNVTIFECYKKLAGSKPSGFLMKPSWFSGLGKEVYKPSLELLDKLYGLQKIKFRVGPLKTYAYRVSREAVINDPKLKYVHQKVIRVGPSEGKGLDAFLETDKEEYAFDLVIVAAGVWSGTLVDVPNLVGKKGVSFEWEAAKVEKNRISPWAPYKQTVVFNVPGEDKVWGGDGTALIPENWTDSRDDECLERVAKVSKLPLDKVTKIHGIRPYIEGVKPCLIERRGRRLWVVTGGAKNGSVAAGWAAYKMVKEYADD